MYFQPVSDRKAAIIVLVLLRKIGEKHLRSFHDLRIPNVGTYLRVSLIFRKCDVIYETVPQVGNFIFTKTYAQKLRENMPIFSAETITLFPIIFIRTVFYLALNN